MNEIDFQIYFPEKIISIEKINHVGNNHLFKIILPGKTRLAKIYSSVHIDNWPRAKCEYFSLQKLWDLDIRSIPKPFLFDENNNLAIYSFEEGVLLKQNEIGKEDIVKAVDFLLKLKSIKNEDKIRFSPATADGLSLIKYVGDVEKRINHLTKSLEENSIPEKMKNFFFNEAVPEARGIIDDFMSKFTKEQIDKELPLEEQTLSFGDFGFHNILVDQDRNFKFIDFEYFGRDDPVRELLGFVHHDKHSAISYELKKLFIDRFVERNPDIVNRLRIVDPLKGLSWVFTILNIFSKKYLENLKKSGAEVDMVVEERFLKAQNKLKNLRFFN